MPLLCAKKPWRSKSLSLGPTHQLPQHTTNIGLVLDNKGDYVGAIDMYQKALVIQEPLLGVHPDTAETHNNIGLSLYKKGDHRGALQQFQESYIMYHSSLGLGHLATQNLQINIETTKRKMALKIAMVYILFAMLFIFWWF